MKKNHRDKRPYQQSRSANTYMCAVHPENPDHDTDKCNAFPKLTPKKRLNLVVEFNLCKKCLQKVPEGGYDAHNSTCAKSGAPLCKTCDSTTKPHHTLLCLNSGLKTPYKKKSTMPGSQIQSMTSLITTMTRCPAMKIPTRTTMRRNTLVVGTSLLRKNMTRASMLHP